MQFTYQWQKAYEALSSLTSDCSMDTRLVNAGHTLCGFPSRGLPEDEMRQALVVERAFCSYPASWANSRNDGDVAALIRILPERRKRVLVELVISLHGAICKLQGRAEAGLKIAGLKEPLGLESPDRWEFLFWNLATGDSAEERKLYTNYAKEWLPNFPEEVLLEWIGRHGDQGLQRWSFLDLERLTFSDEMWTFDKIKAIQSLESVFTRIGPDSLGAYRLSCGNDWIGKHILDHGTWSSPIIVFDNPRRLKRSGCDIPKGLVLIEGHNRLSRLLNAPGISTSGKAHRVMLAFDQTRK